MRLNSNFKKKIKETAALCGCPLINKITEVVNVGFEVMCEDFDCDEDVLIVTNVAKLYANEMYQEAISVLAIAFMMREVDNAGDLTAAVGASKDAYCIKAFLTKFLDCFEDSIAIREESKDKKLN